MWEEDYETPNGADNSLANPAAAMAKGECEDDVQKFCKNVGQAKGAVVACLQQHMAELSEACKTKLSEQPS